MIVSIHNKVSKTEGFKVNLFDVLTADKMKTNNLLFLIERKSNGEFILQFCHSVCMTVK